MKNNLAELMEIEEIEDLDFGSDDEKKELTTADFLHLVSEPTKDELALLETELGKEPDEVLAVQKVNVRDNGYNMDSLQIYLKDVSKYATLSREEEIELVRAGEWGRKEMVKHNLRWVISIAKKYIGIKGLELQDLIQEGNIGLLHAAENFRLEKNCKFTTYATWWIRQAIIRALADKSRNIRIPIHIVELLIKMGKSELYLRQKLGHKASNEKLAANMGVKAELIEKLKKIRTQTICSLSDPVNSQNDESESSREYFIADTRAKSPEAETVKINGEKFWLSVSRILGCNGNGKIVLEIINQRNLFTTKEERELGKRKKSLKEVLDEMNIPNLNLQERSFYIEVMRRIGFTLEDLGEEFAITRERIRQIGSSNERKLGTEKSKAELRQYR